KSGSFFSYGETRLGQGRNNAKQFLVDNPELAGEIEAKVRAGLGIDGEGASAGAAEPEPTTAPAPGAEAKAAEGKPRGLLAAAAASRRIGSAPCDEQRNPFLHLRDRACGLGRGDQPGRAQTEGLPGARPAGGRPLVRDPGWRRDHLRRPARPGRGKGEG